MFFITFRLNDSLPQTLVRTLSQQLEDAIHRIEKEENVDRELRVKEERKRSFGKVDKVLDKGSYGNCWLRRPEIAQTLADKLWEYHQDLYNLQAYCIMPNHVHLLMDTSIQKEGDKPIKLDEIMRRIKGGSAREINQKLNRKGRLWQKDSYDYLVRDQEEWERIYAYLLNNPVKAGLVDQASKWEFSYGCNE
ncbi:MAG: transposase [Bacteroidota bacterium]